jgi:hypothetical protein
MEKLKGCMVWSLPRRARAEGLDQRGLSRAQLTVQREYAMFRIALQENVRCRGFGGITEGEGGEHESKDQMIGDQTIRTCPEPGTDLDLDQNISFTFSAAEVDQSRQFVVTRVGSWTCRYLGSMPASKYSLM